MEPFDALNRKAFGDESEAKRAGYAKKQEHNA
jgi:hypothetical protein